jgi:general stress protein YciG
MATSDRGFASMDPKRQREIARMGGLKSHSGGRKASGAAGKTEAAKRGGQTITPN